MNKKIFVSIIIVILVIILGFLLWNNRQITKNQEAKNVDEFEQMINEDDSKSIINDLDQIEIDSTIDSEINPIDEEMKNL